MAARLLLSSGARALRSTGAATQRSFQTSAPRLYADAAPLPASKPLGAFRGGLFGFLVGATLAGSGTYYYVLQDYKASNELLQDDIYAGAHTAFNPHHTCRLPRKSRKPGIRAGSLTLFGVSIQALQAATQRMSNYLTTLEEKIDTMEKKKK